MRSILNKQKFIAQRAYRWLYVCIGLFTNEHTHKYIKYLTKPDCLRHYVSFDLWNAAIELFTAQITDRKQTTETADKREHERTREDEGESGHVFAFIEYLFAL